jgi:sulfofructose kinase
VPGQQPGLSVGDGSVGVFGIGVACLDYLLQVPRLSQVPHGCDLQTLKLQGGGMTATAMVAVARLGGQAELWTVLGQDHHGDVIMSELIEEGIDVSQIAQLPGLRSPFNFVLVDGETGERVFLKPDVDWGRAWTDLDIVPDLSRVDAAGALLVDGHWRQMAVPALQRARQRGMPTCGDIVSIARYEDLLPLIDYLIVPRHAAEEAAGAVAGEAGPRALEALAEFGARMVVVTLGAEGTLYMVDGEVYNLPAFEVQIVDTTGAGDVFHGAFAYGLARGWQPHQLVMFSSAVAALKCTQLGGRTGIPDLKQVQRFLAERMPQENLNWLTSAPHCM